MRLFSLLLPGVLLSTGGVMLASSGTHAARRPALWDEVLSAVVQGDRGPIRDTLAAHLATITTDTGAFAPGRRDFTRYTTLDLCLAAATTTRADVGRTLAVQRSRDTLPQDTLGAGAAARVARACGARFTLATTAPKDLEKFFLLTVAAQDSVLAQTVFTRLLATPYPRLQIYVLGITAYLNMGWWPAVDALVTQFAAYQPADTQLHLRFEGRVANLLPHYTKDPVRLRPGIEQILRVTESPLTPPDDTEFEAQQVAFRQLFLLEQQQPDDSIFALAARVQKALWRFRNLPEVERLLRQKLDWVTWQQLPPRKAMPFEDVAPDWVRYRVRDALRVAPRLQADYWFPAPGQPNGDTLRPVPDKVNVICFGVDEPQAVRLQRWLQRYGADHLAVTLVFPADGYNLGEGGYAHHTLYRTLWPSPAVEADAERWMVQNYFHLPVTVAVQVRHDEWLPPPDGRRLTYSKMQFNVYFDSAYTQPYTWATRAGKFSYESNDSTVGRRVGEGGGACTIIDRAGKILYLTSTGQYQNNPDDALQWVMHQAYPSAGTAR